MIMLILTSCPGVLHSLLICELFNSVLLEGIVMRLHIGGKGIVSP